MIIVNRHRLIQARAETNADQDLAVIGSRIDIVLIPKLMGLVAKQ